MISADFTLREAFELFYQKKRMAPRTLGEWRYCLTRWEKHTTNPRIQDVSEQTFDAFRESAAGLSPQTIERTVERARSILEKCWKRGILLSVPDYGDRLPIAEPRPKVADFESLSAMYLRVDQAHWPNYSERVRGDSGRSKGGWMSWHAQPWAPQFWRVFLVLAYFTGLRLGDLLKLRRDDFSDEVLCVVANKTGKFQTIPVHPCLRRHLDSVTWAKPDEPLLPVGKALKQFRRELERICTAAKVEQVTPKRIRVLSANEWERARPRAGDAILGHSIQRKVTRYYLRPPLALEEALPRLRVPSAFLTAEEREHGQDRLQELQRLFDSMPGDSQDLLLGMARRLK